MNRLIQIASFAVVGLAGHAQSFAQENFDQAGASWNPTIYVDRWDRGGTFWRSTFAGDPCLPPIAFMPIAPGGDKEGAYSHPGAQGCEAYAMVDIIPAHQVADSRTEGFIHLCPMPGSNVRATAGFVARARMAGGIPGPNQSYQAVLSAPPGTNDVYLLLIRDLDGCLDTMPADGVIDAVDILSSIGPIGTTASNYQLRFEVVGNTLTAQARRAFAAGGALAFDPPVTLTAMDNAIADGFNGVVGYAPFNNRVYWDGVDIDVAGGGNPGDPGNPCLCDWNNDREVNSQDFFEYISAFFAQNRAADLNEDDRVNSQDFFAFISCFFDRCN